MTGNIPSNHGSAQVSSDGAITPDGQLTKPSFLSHLPLMKMAGNTPPPIVRGGGLTFGGQTRQPSVLPGESTNTTGSPLHATFAHLGSGGNIRKTPDAVSEILNQDQSTQGDSDENSIPHVDIDPHGSQESDNNSSPSEVSPSIVLSAERGVGTAMNLKDRSMGIILQKAEVKPELLLRIYGLKPSHLGAMSLLSRELSSGEIIRIWQLGRENIVPVQYWETAASKINWERIDPKTMLTLCDDVKQDSLWIQAILTRKFDSSVLIRFLSESNYSFPVLETILDNNLIEITDLIALNKETDEASSIEAFSSALIKYIQKIKSINSNTTTEWQTMLLNIAIELDSASFWDFTTFEIAENAE